MSVRFDMRMDEDLRERLKQYCAVTGQSMSEAVTRMLTACLNEHDAKLKNNQIVTFPYTSETEQ